MLRCINVSVVHKSFEEQMNLHVLSVSLDPIQTKKPGRQHGVRIPDGKPSLHLDLLKKYVHMCVYLNTDYRNFINHISKLFKKVIIITSQFLPHRIDGIIFIYFCGQVLPSCKMLESKKRIPLTCSSATRIMLNNLQIKKHLNLSILFNMMQHDESVNKILQYYIPPMLE